MRLQSGLSRMHFVGPFLLFFLASGYLVVISEGSLLSAYLRMKSVYVVNRVDDDAKSDEVTQFASGTSYTDCGSNAHIQSLRINSCDHYSKLTRVGLSAEGEDEERGSVSSDICEIKRGSNVTFNLSFVAQTNATQLKAVIHGIVDYVPIPFPCPQPDACQNSGIECPVLSGKQYDYTLSAPTKTSYPKMKLWIKGQLEDENGNNVICVKIHVHLV